MRVKAPLSLCTCCGVAARGDLLRIQIWWKRAGTTSCNICSGCWKALRVRRFVAGAMLIIGSIATIAAGISAVVLITNIWVGRQRDRDWYTQWGITAAIITIISLAAVLLSARVRVPAPLRIGRKARHLVRFQRLGVLSDAEMPAGAPIPTLGFGDAIAQSIESGDSIYALGDLCGRLPDGIRCYADYQAARYAPQYVTPQCCSCGDEEIGELHLTQWTWQSPADGDRTSSPGVVALMFLAGHIHISGWKRVEFQTYHAFCSRCLRSARNRRSLVSLMILMLCLFLFISFIAILGGFVVVLVDKHHEQRMLGWFVFAGGIFLIILGVWLFQFFKKLRVPIVLRRIARTPFKLKGVKALT